MCECYDPNGPKYCDIHAESMIGSNSKGLESMMRYSTSSKSGYTSNGSNY
jgi:hypothetical protein